MLVNATKEKHVSFVSYSGCYPNLCTGLLILLVDGVEYKFNPYIVKPTGEYYPSFWHSGGGLDGDYCPYQAPWNIDVSELPEEIRKYAPEIDEIFNENVPHGCCGGCS